MNEEEKKAIEYFKDLDISFNTLLRIDLNGFRNSIQLVLNLIEKQQKEIKARLEEIDCLYKFISIREERIDELVEINEKYNDLYISKDKIKEIIEKHKKFLSNEFSKYDEDDIENRKAIQYASARLSFLLADIYKLGE